MERVVETRYRYELPKGDDGITLENPLDNGKGA